MARVLGLSAKTLFCQKVIPQILPDSSSEERKWVLSALTELEELARLGYFLHSNETSRYALPWHQRWNSARQANNSAALQALLREDLALGYDMKQLTPEEKAKWTQLAQDEYQKWV